MKPLATAAGYAPPKPSSDRLREHVDARDGADVERLAGESMASAADLGVAGVELAALGNDDGQLDVEKVTEAVERVLADRPHWHKAPVVNFDGGARTTPGSAPAHPCRAALTNAGRSWDGDNHGGRRPRGARPPATIVVHPPAGRVRLTRS